MYSSPGHSDIFCMVFCMKGGSSFEPSLEEEAVREVLAVRLEMAFHRPCSWSVLRSKLLKGSTLESPCPVKACTPGGVFGEGLLHTFRTRHCNWLQNTHQTSPNAAHTTAFQTTCRYHELVIMQGPSTECCKELCRVLLPAVAIRMARYAT